MSITCCQRCYRNPLNYRYIVAGEKLCKPCAEMAPDERQAAADPVVVRDNTPTARPKGERWSVLDAPEKAAL